MSLFTVEQLELIRRLRSTGITGEAVLEAFRTLEKIESDLDATRAQSAALAALIAPSRLLSTHGSSTSSDDHGATSDVDLPEQQLGHQSTMPTPQMPNTVAGIASSLLASTSNPLLLQRLTSQPPRGAFAAAHYYACRFALECFHITAIRTPCGECRQKVPEALPATNYNSGAAWS
ncbi:hypothetical protein AAVH_08573 [Aphelenchoides avenae]|nr:hypothetical protein AAVH_08573 [Aphelenchus avenae]